MRNKIIIDNDIVINVVNTETENFNKTDTPHTQHAYTKKIAQGEASAFLDILETVKKDSDEILTFLALLAGTGWNSSLALKHLDLEKMFLNDFSLDCCKSLYLNFESVTHPKIKIYNKNAYDFIKKFNKKIDFISISRNEFSLREYKDDNDTKEMFNWTFEHANKFVSFIDSALYGGIRFDNVREYYSKMFKKEMDNDFNLYYKFFGILVKKKFNFGIKKVVKHKNMRYATILFEKGYDGEMEIIKSTNRLKVKYL